MDSSFKQECQTDTKYARRMCGKWIVPHVLILSNHIAGIYLLRYLAYNRRHVVITSVKLKVIIAQFHFFLIL